ncbi:MAG: hypothetical protein OXH85_02515 [Truepera sp.]|nr:hypothetical protein [Truepera sp.]
MLVWNVGCAAVTEGGTLAAAVLPLLSLGSSELRRRIYRSRPRATMT